MKRALNILGLTTVLAMTIAACGSEKDTFATTGGTGGTGGPGGTAGGTPGAPGAGPGAGTSGIPGGIPGTPGSGLPPTSTGYTKDATDTSGLDKATLDTLKAGGAQCTAKVLYPYNDTVFPGGLISPEIMWEGAADAAYVHVTYQGQTLLDFQYAIAATNPGSLRIPQEHWNEITRRAQVNYPNLSVTLTTMSGGAVSTCALNWRIAVGNMVGAIYYNTYNHPAAGGLGAVLRLPLGQPQAEIYLNQLGLPPIGPCMSCHSVSAKGSQLAVSSHAYAFSLGEQFQTFATPISAAPQPTTLTRIADATFGALTPDGKYILQMGNPDCTAGAETFPRSPNNFPLLQGPSKAQLLDTATGQFVDTTGIDTARSYMWMPQFSPDGRKVVFNYAKPDGQGGTDRRELAVMDFDQGTRTFSNLRVIASRQGVEPSIAYNPGPAFLADGAGGSTPGNDNCPQTLTGPQTKGYLAQGSCTGPCYPAWPFFTPDGRGVVYSLTSEPDFAVAFPGRAVAAKSELWYANIDGAPVSYRLDTANLGLPGEDVLNNYYPTMLPVQVGGYYWLFWTSTRRWGHQNLNTPVDALGAGALYGPAAADAFKKRIWVTAISASTQGELASGINSDPSFPGFYLEGQSATGNTRAFAALNPCKEKGNECTSGIDCCTGYCTIPEGAAKGVCTDEMRCSKTNEKCSFDTDCCPPANGEAANSCIGGFCGFVVLR